MPSIQIQFPDLMCHPARRAVVDPLPELKRSASDRGVFITGASRGICQPLTLSSPGPIPVRCISRLDRNTHKKRYGTWSNGPIPKRNPIARLSAEGRCRLLLARLGEPSSRREDWPAKAQPPRPKPEMPEGQR